MNMVSKNSKMIPIICLIFIIISSVFYWNVYSNKKYEIINHVLKLAFTQNKDNVNTVYNNEITEKYKAYCTEDGIRSFEFYYFMETDITRMCENSPWEMTVGKRDITQYKNDENYYDFDVEVICKNTENNEEDIRHIKGKTRLADDGKIDFWRVDQASLKELDELKQKFQSE